jgi:two-component system, response regulator
VNLSTDRNADSIILVIEDNADDQDLLIHQLQRSGIKDRVLCIANGGDALELVHSGAQKISAVCAIFLDLSLPGVNGFLLLEAIRANVKTALLPVFIMTGSANPADEAECRRLGATSFFPKQFLSLPSFRPTITNLFRASKLSEKGTTPFAEQNP